MKSQVSNLTEKKLAEMYTWQTLLPHMTPALAPAEVLATPVDLCSYWGAINSVFRDFS